MKRIVRNIYKFFPCSTISIDFLFCLQNKLPDFVFRKILSEANDLVVSPKYESIKLSLDRL